MGRGGQEVAPDSTDSATSFPATRKVGPMPPLVPTLSGARRQAAEAGEKPLLVGIKGQYYDITEFAKRHPGGDIIYDWVGGDATEVFFAFHGPDGDRLLKHRNPVGQYAWNPPSTTRDYLSLGEAFERKGYFKSSRLWVVRQYLRIVLYAAAFFWLLQYSASWVVVALQGVLMACMWQQCGGLMHDYGHTTLGQTRDKDWIGGWLAGTVGIGIIGSWWRAEHNVHHALTNTFDDAEGNLDPQMHEEVWCQAPEIIPWHRDSKVKRFFFRLQAWYFLPMCFIVGRTGIILAGITSTKVRANFRWFHWALDWIGLMLHAAWVGGFLYAVHGANGSVWAAPVCYVVANCFQGFLSIQLLVNHYGEHFAPLEQVKRDWVRQMVEANCDISWWAPIDFLGVGLQFHLVHHLYPRMPREHFRAATKDVHERICKAHNLSAKVVTYTQGVRGMLQQLDSVGKMMSLVGQAAQGMHPST